MKQIIGILSLIRPLNMLIVFAAVLIGGGLCGHINNDALISAICAMLILAGGNSINDYFDANADAIAHPGRPIPSGKISRKAVPIIAVILFCMGIVPAIRISTIHIIVATGAVLMLITYSMRLSSLPILGNISIAALSGIAVIFGALSNAICPKSIWAAIIATALHLPREIFKDIQDISGDKAMNRSTLPIACGESCSYTIGIAIIIIAIGVIIATYFQYIFGKRYMFLSSIAIVLCALAIFFASKRKPEITQTLLKLSMITGLIALGTEIIQ